MVVAVCQNTPSDIQIHAKVPKTGFSDLRNIFSPPFGRFTPVWGPTELPINHLWWPLLVRLTFQNVCLGATLQHFWPILMKRNTLAH